MDVCCVSVSPLHGGQHYSLYHITSFCLRYIDAGHKIRPMLARNMYTDVSQLVGLLNLFVSEVYVIYGCLYSRISK